MTFKTDENLQAIIDFVEGRLTAEEFERVLYDRAEFEDILNNNPPLPPDTTFSQNFYLYVVSLDFRDPAGMRTPSYNQWQQLDDHEKRELLKQALRSVGCLGKRGKGE